MLALGPAIGWRWVWSPWWVTYVMNGRGQLCWCWFCWTAQQLPIPSAMVSFWAIYLGCDLEALFYSDSSPSWMWKFRRWSQSSVLSPVLFNIYMKQLEEVLQSLGVWCPTSMLIITNSFLSIYFQGSYLDFQLMAGVRNRLDEANKLNLNPDKIDVALNN